MNMGSKKELGDGEKKNKWKQRGYLTSQGRSSAMVLCRMSAFYRLMKNILYRIGGEKC